MIAAMAETAAIDSTEAGARNSKSDLSKIQAMHDHAVALGAKCTGGDDETKESLREPETAQEISLTETVPWEMGDA
jgi:hypothetical protein